MAISTKNKRRLNKIFTPVIRIWGPIRFNSFDIIGIPVLSILLGPFVSMPVAAFLAVIIGLFSAEMEYRYGSS